MNDYSNKVMYIITRSEWGGAQKHLLDLCENGSRKFKIKVLVGERGELTDNLEALNIEYSIISNLKNKISIKNDFRSTMEIIKEINSFSPDILHLHSTKAGLLGRISAKIAKSNTRVIFTAHGWGFTKGTKILNKLFSLSIELLTNWMVNKTICVSKYDELLAKKYARINPDKVTTIYNGVKINETLPLRNKNKDKLILTMVARVDKQKDFDTLVETVAVLKEQNKRLYNQLLFQLVGRGPELENINSKIIIKDLGDAIKTLGFRKDAAKIVSDSDVFILISNYEGLPISIIEAMSFGKPLIVSDVGGVSELINDNGYLIKKEGFKKESIEIINAITELANNEEKLHKYGFNSKEIFLDKFTINKCVEDTFNLYYKEIGEVKC